MIKARLLIALILMAICLGTVSCTIDRSDPKAVAEATFHAVFAKDYRKFHGLCDSVLSIPSEQEWDNALFIRDYTPSEEIKNSWKQGPLSEYMVSDIRFEDYQQPKYSLTNPFPGGFLYAHGTERIGLVDFVHTGKRFMAIFPIILQDGKWSPGMNPRAGEFFIRFEEWDE